MTDGACFAKTLRRDAKTSLYPADFDFIVFGVYDLLSCQHVMRCEDAKTTKLLDAMTQ